MFSTSRLEGLHLPLPTFRDGVWSVGMLFPETDVVGRAKSSWGFPPP